MLEAKQAPGRARYLAQLRKKSVGNLTRILYRYIRGILISSEVRKVVDGDTGKKDDAHLTYGEIRVESFDLALSHASKYCSINTAEKEHNIFYDLGSGTGKALFVAAFNLHHHFECVRGIEIMTELHDVTKQVLERYKLGMTAAEEKTICGRVFHASLKHSNSSDNEKKAGKVYSEAELRSLVETISEGMGEGGGEEGELANALVRKIGHKSFKASIKPFKTFHRFMEASNSGGEEGTKKESELPLDNPPPPDAGSDDAQRLGDEVSSAPDAHNSSVESLLLLEKDVMASLTNPAPSTMSAHCGDIFTSTWYEDASIAYCSSLLFNEEMMIQLLDQVVQMRPGSVFMSLKKLPEPPSPPVVDGESRKKVQLVFEAYYEMSWHRNKVYFYSISL